jgi:predicted Zn-dependent peptidase
VGAFITGQNWKDYVSTIDRLSKVTKEDIMKFAQSNFNQNYVCVYKATGEDTNVQKVTKPEITPVDVNREDQSDFLKKITNTPAKEIEPVFVDYKKDIQQATLKSNVPLYYNANTENKTFNLYYIFETGTNNDKKLELAINYLKFLGTAKMKAAEVQEQFYRYGCSFDVFASEEQIYVSLSGLTENIEKATDLFEDLLANAEPNEEALKNMISDVLKKRDDAKLNKSEILFSALSSFGKYGKQTPYNSVLSADQLKGLSSKELVIIIRNLISNEHHILYYGSNSLDEVVKLLNTKHRVPEKLKPLPPLVKFNTREESNEVFVVDYDMKQAEIILLAKDGMFEKSMIPKVRMFNEYFGGGMSSIVFQDMRESKALAYSVFATYQQPQKKDDFNYVFAYIGTQADKLPEAMKGMFELFNTMPESENNFKSAQEAIVQSIRTERITRTQILFSYENAKKRGLDYDVRKDIFAEVPKMTLADIKDFELKHLKEKKYTVLVLGKKESLNMDVLSKYGKVNFVSLNEIFGY